MTTDLTKYATSVDPWTKLAHSPLSIGITILGAILLIGGFAILATRRESFDMLELALVTIVLSTLALIAGILFIPQQQINNDTRTFGAQIAETWNIQAFGCQGLDTSRHATPPSGSWQCSWVSADGKRMVTGRMAVNGTHVGLFDANGKPIKPTNTTNSQGKEAK